MTAPAGEPRRLSMYSAALTVVKTLRENGHVALFAGGCVRDQRMGKRPHDFDVATDAPPDRIVALFRRTRKVGMQFGVVLVGMRQFWIEVATFRSDGVYLDGRRPESVQFTDAREDALRRDFTINGMFYDPIERKVIDYVGGEADIAARRIRAIGPAAQRFAEDHLRLLRAIRFAARFDFEIEPATWSAIAAHAPLIKKISPERIHDELERMLTHPRRARAFADLHAAGLLPHLWPGSEAIAEHHAAIHALLAALPASASFELGLTALLHRLPLGFIEEVCKALTCSNRTTKTVVWLVTHQDDLLNPDVVTLADLKLLMARPPFTELLDLLAAKLAAEGRQSTAHRTIVARAHKIAPDEVSPPALITGKHLGKMGLPPGPKYKAILEKVYYAQLNGDVRDKSEARNYARRLVEDAE